MTIEALTFNQLSQKAKENAISIYLEKYLPDQWHESVIEDAKSIGALMGIEIDKVFFTGFSCQGDGACFNGSFSYQKGAVEQVKQYAPLDTKLHRIAEDYAAVQRKAFYKLVGKVQHEGHYYHSNCTEISVEHADDQYRDIGELYADMKDVLRAFMDWIYDELEKDYDFQASESEAAECFDANDIKFTESGKIH